MVADAVLARRKAHGNKIPSMKKSVLLVFLILTGYTGFSQYDLDDFFITGRTGYGNFIKKNSRYGQETRIGRYGLCLVSFSLHKNDSVKNIRILSAPSRKMSEETTRVIRLSHDLWKYPKTAKMDSLNILAGIYYIQAGDDFRSGKKYPSLSYDALYAEYKSTGFETDSPECFATPFFFIGVVTVKRYATHSVE